MKYTAGFGMMYGVVDVDLPEDYSEDDVRTAIWEAIKTGKLNVEDFEVGDVW